MPENRLEIIISLVLKEQLVGLKPRQPFLKPTRCSFKGKNCYCIVLNICGLYLYFANAVYLLNRLDFGVYISGQGIFFKPSPI